MSGCDQCARTGASRGVSLGVGFVALLAIVGTSALEPPPTAASPTVPAPPQVPMPPEPYWIPRTDAELDTLLAASCDQAVAAGQPVLLAFSASWCGDCKRVRVLEGESPLREELAGWTEVIVDVGRFDRHRSILQAFQVSKVATWVALEPACGAPVTEWRRLGSDVFEPASNPDGVKTAADLAVWLVAAREAR